jgi:two-component system chemotaxis response regulator CheB
MGEKRPARAKKDIVVIGASAGGMEALQTLARGLPRDLPASIFVVWHLPPGIRSMLPMLLSSASALHAAHPRDGDAIEHGRIYVAPSDHHMLLEHGYVRITKGPKENRFRPAIDPMFRSAAYAYGARAIGVVLSGALDDGTSGLWTLKLRGGTAIVQDPADAHHRSMPLSALANVEVDYKLPVAQIGALIGRLAREDAAPDAPMPEEGRRRLEHDVHIAEGREALEEEVIEQSALSPFTCPECRGVLTLIREGGILRFRCHTGHAFSSGTLLDSAGGQVEARLWDAVRALDETVMLLNRLGEDHLNAGNTGAAEHYFDLARETHERSRPIREAAMQSERFDFDYLEAGKAG